MDPVASAPDFREAICPVKSVICWVQEKFIDFKFV